MKYVLLAILIVLVTCSVLTAWYIPDSRSPVPVIRWVTDNNPARLEQIKLFRDWLAKNDTPGNIRLDVTNADPTKKIIQSVSGIGADIMDISNGGQMAYFNAIGFLADVTAQGKALGFDPSRTYAAIKPILGVINDAGEYEQRTFPCNVSTDMFIVNRGAFRRFHQPDPPKRWTFDEYEKRGIDYVTAANPPGVKREYYFSVQPDHSMMRQSAGVGDFDETQTHCTLDDPRYVDVLNRIARWRQLHITPTSADQASFSSGDSQYGGITMSLFDRGNYAMLSSGRYLVIGFRDFNIGRVSRGEPPLDLAVVEPPNNGFPVVNIQTRAAAVYKGTRDLNLACHFLAFLASREYNDQIIRDGDALPPDPQMTHSEAFLHPAEDPARGIYKQTEWNFHGPFVEAAETIASPHSISPFILGSVFDREDQRARDRFLEGGDVTAEQAVHEAQSRINDEIQRMVRENPSLLPRYEALCRQQVAIDALKAAGKKIPLKWIIDPFRRKYEQAMGMTE